MALGRAHRRGPSRPRPLVHLHRPLPYHTDQTMQSWSPAPCTPNQRLTSFFTLGVTPHIPLSILFCPLCATTSSTNSTTTAEPATTTPHTCPLPVRVRVHMRVFVSLLCGRQVANRRCVNSMCTLSCDKMHTVYHGHSRVPRPTAPFHCKHPQPGTPSVAFPFRKMCSMTKTPGPSPRVGATSEVTMALLVSSA